jgi:hypothetical protein
VVLLLLGLVLHQRWQLSRARAQWAAIGPRVEAVREIMNYAKAHGAWFNDQPETLDLLRAVTLAFPEHGGVWVTRVELRDRRSAVIAGKATSREAWLQTLDAVRQTAGIRDLRVSQARAANDGKSPMTFTLSFTWQPTAPASQRRREASP